MSTSNLTFAKYVGDGKRVSFPIATNGESMGYFRSLDINGYVDGEKVVTHIDYNSPHMLIFAVAPKDKSEVMVRREMPLRLPYANFERGNNFGHRQVNNTFLQQLYLTQELLDGFYPEGFYLKQDLNVGSNRVTNVADAKEDSDAINKGQVDAMDAEMTEWQEEQDGRILDLEQSITAGNLVYRRVVFTATQGQSEFNPNATFGSILNLYINGVNQIAGEAYESVGGRLIKTVPLDEGDRVVAIIGQEPQFVEPEQTDFRYVRYPYYATGGELTILIPFAFKQVMSVYINGIHQTYEAAFTYNSADKTVTFADSLDAGDEVLMYMGDEPAVEGDASNLPVTSESGVTSTLKGWMQKIVDFGKNLVTSIGSTTARTLEDRFADKVNIKDFGAVGDYFMPDGSVNPNPTPNSVAIQKAFDYANLNSKAVYVPAGSYMIEAALTLPKLSVIKGDGMNASIFIPNMLDGYAFIYPDSRQEKIEGIGVRVTNPSSEVTAFQLNNPQRTAVMEKCRIIIGKGSCFEANNVYHFVMRDVSMEGTWVAEPSSTNLIHGTAWYQPNKDNEANNILFDKCEFNFLATPIVSETTLYAGSNTMKFNECAFQHVGKYVADIRGWYAEFNNCYFEWINANYSDIPNDTTMDFSFMRGGAGDLVFNHSLLNLGHIVHGVPVFGMIIGNVVMGASTELRLPEELSEPLIEEVTYNDRGLLLNGTSTFDEDAFLGKSSDVGGYTSGTITPSLVYKESGVSKNEFEFLGLKVTGAFNNGEWQDCNIQLKQEEDYLINVEAEYNYIDDSTGTLSYLKSNMSWYITSGETSESIAPSTTDNSQKSDTNNYMTTSGWDEPCFLKYIKSGSNYKLFHLMRSAKSFGSNTATLRTKYKVRIENLSNKTECGIVPVAGV